jgi:antagonist of KipI
MTIRITGAGLQTTIQDLGRPRFQHAAIPGGGAMDRTACRVANLLVGNSDEDAVIEAALIGPSIEFEAPTLFALGGGDLDASIDGRSIPVFHPVVAPAGSVLRFGQPKSGCRAYVAFAGGIDVPLVFGSRSTYLRASFGGHEGRALRAGDRLRTGVPSASSMAIQRSLASDSLSIGRWSIGATIRPNYGSDVVVRVIDGTHTLHLSDDSRHRLLDERFRVSSSSDRMGYRLEGATLGLRAPVELLSEAVTFGTIQLPPGGAPIILMADRQTTGGYPRIGAVASVDLPLVAQLKPGDALRFRPISVDEAQQLHLALEAELAQARAGIRLRFLSGKTA